MKMKFFFASLLLGASVSVSHKDSTTELIFIQLVITKMQRLSSTVTSIQ